MSSLLIHLHQGFVYARGATDNKGQHFTYLKAVDAILRTRGELPLNTKFLLEGEEEIGSPHLANVLSDHRLELTPDAIAISDGSQFAPGMPAITYALRGLCYLQIDVQGPRFDLHSGSYGGVVANPIQVLCHLVAQLKRPDGSIAIPGFYDEVLPLAEWERQEMRELPFDEKAMLDYLGVHCFAGEDGYTVVERKAGRPTLDVNGIWGGFSGEGAKTIIPARAGAKVSMRLVPNQRAETINALFKDFVASLAPAGVEVKIEELHGSDPVLVSRDRPAVQAAKRAIEQGFSRAPLFIREGGSIPIVGLFHKILACEDILLLGWGRPDDGAHSPNERFSVADFQSGIRSAAALFFELAASLGSADS